MDTKVIFPGLVPDPAPFRPAPPWKVLVVGDEDEVHQAIRPSLSGFRFGGRTLDLLEARSVAQARLRLDHAPDTAVVLLDVTPESRAAGLALIEDIHRRTDEHPTRVILRATLPEAMPPPEVLGAALDAGTVSACGSRSALTGASLQVALAEALGAFSCLLAERAGQRRLARLETATSELFQAAPHEFHASLLLQLGRLLEVETGPDALFATGGDGSPPGLPLRIQAGTGRFAGLCDAGPDALPEPAVTAVLQSVRAAGETVHAQGHVALLLDTGVGILGLAYVEGTSELGPTDRQLLEVFRRKAVMAFRDFVLLEELNASQRATVVALARLAEYKDHADSGHLQRIERLSTEIARELHRRGACPDELDELLVGRIGLASILHDVGMTSVPDAILSVPGELVEEDFRLIFQHTRIGARILGEAAEPLCGRSLLSIAAEIALSHHERHDGSGYPDRLRGQAIPLTARIVAVADVFDALISERPYKRAWPVEEAIGWIEDQAGADFDPEVVDAFLSVIERILAEEPGWLPRSSLPDAAAASEKERPKSGLRSLIDRILGRQD